MVRIDVAAFAEPEHGEGYGKTLYRERIHVTQADVEVSFITDAEPTTVGIDPFLLLIDRVPDDNCCEPE